MTVASRSWTPADVQSLGIPPVWIQGSRSLCLLPGLLSPAGNSCSSRSSEPSWNVGLLSFCDCRTNSLIPPGFVQIHFITAASEWTGRVNGECAVIVSGGPTEEMQPQSFTRIHQDTNLRVPQHQPRVRRPRSPKTRRPQDGPAALHPASLTGTRPPAAAAAASAGFHQGLPDRKYSFYSQKRPKDQSTGSFPPKYKRYHKIQDSAGYKIKETTLYEIQHDTRYNRNRKIQHNLTDATRNKIYNKIQQIPQDTARFKIQQNSSDETRYNEIQLIQQDTTKCNRYKIQLI